MSKITQWVNGLTGASGSMTVRARLSVPAGTPLQLSGGETSTPEQVNSVGMVPPFVNAELVSVMDCAPVAACASAPVAMSSASKATSHRGTDFPTTDHGSAPDANWRHLTTRVVGHPGDSRFIRLALAPEAVGCIYSSTTPTGG